MSFYKFDVYNQSENQLTLNAETIVNVPDQKSNIIHVINKNGLSPRINIVKGRAKFSYAAGQKVVLQLDHFAGAQPNTIEMCIVMFQETFSEIPIQATNFMFKYGVILKLGQPAEIFELFFDGTKFVRGATHGQRVDYTTIPSGRS